MPGSLPLIADVDDLRKVPARRERRWDDFHAIP